jgi:TRAP transporter TAXI family solute receptor
MLDSLLPSALTRRLAVAALWTAALVVSASVAAAADSQSLPACPTSKAAAKEKAGAKRRLVIGTGNTGGVFFPYGGGLARVISAKVPNTTMTAEVTGGSVDNLKLLARHEADLALTTVDSAWEAALGAGVYADVGKVPACAVALLYQSFVHIVASGDGKVTKIADLKGRRVSLGSPGSSTEVLAIRVLEAAGLDAKKDVSPQYLSVSEAAGALRDGKLDAFFWIGGLPTAAVQDLVSSPGPKPRFLDGGALVDALRKKHGPIYDPMTLPKAVYGLEADVAGIGVGNLLVAHADAPEALVADLLGAVFANLDEVHKIHPEARALTLEGAASGGSLPYHPAALAFFKTKGVGKKQ